MAAAHPVAAFGKIEVRAVWSRTLTAACTARRSAWTAVWSRPTCTALVSRTSHRPLAGSRARLVPVKPVCDTAVGGQWPPRMSKPSPGQAQP